MDDIHSLQIVLLSLCIVLSAFFSGTETALFAMSISELKRWKESGTTIQRLAATSLDDHNATLILILLGNNFLNIWAAILFNRLSSGFDPLVSGILITVIILLFAEMIPKTVAYQHRQKIAAWHGPIILYLRQLFWPLICIFQGFTERVLDRLGGRKVNNAISIDEYETFVSLGKDLGTFTARESKILEAIFRFRKVQAITIMIPRTELCSVDIGLNSEQIMKVISQYRYRYLTIINKSFDNFIGVLDIKRFAMGYLLMKKHWSQTCVQKAVYVPELATLNYVLAQLRNEKQKVAMVVDEYGGISGLISIDDIIEEIIGELSDEFKNPSWDIIQKTPRHWQLSGLVPLQELRNSLAIILPSGLSAETVGGLIINKLGHLPKTGESIIIDHYRFEVRHCRRHSIVAVDLYDIEKTES